MNLNKFILVTSLALPFSVAAIIFLPGVAFSLTTLTELFNGGSIQVGEELLSNFTLGNKSVTGSATDFNFDNIIFEEEPTPDAFYPGTNGAAIYANNQELSVFGVGRKSFSYNFKVTSLANTITQIQLPLRYRSYDGFSPFLTGTIDVGTTQGSSNIGSATSVYSPYQVVNGTPLSIPNLSSFWVNTSIDVSSDSGYAQLGYLSDGSQGRAYQLLFVQSVPWETDALPVVGSTVLFGLGIWGKHKLAQKKNKKD